VTKLATAFVEVRPDTGGFSAALRRQLAVAGQGAHVRITPDTGGFSTAMRSITGTRRSASVKIAPDTGNFSSALRREVTNAVAGVGGPVSAALGRTLRSDGAAIGVGLGVALVGGFAVAVGAAGRFERGLSAVRAVANATEAQMEAVRAKALQLGADTAFSASQAAGAMEELVKAGLSVEQVLSGAADAAVSLAAAGGVSLETAATVAANALNQFSLGGTQTARVADIVAGAANASAIGVSDFALSLSQAGAVARTAGLSFDDTALAIAAMGNAGIRGSDAGTSLKTFLQNLIPVTNLQKQAFRELGLVTETGANRFFTAAGSAKSLAEIAGELERALRGMGDQQRLATLEVLFGSDAIRAAAILAREGAQGLGELAAEMGDISAAEVAAQRMDNLAGSFEQFRGSLETVLIKIGSPLQGGLRGLVDLGTRGLNTLSGLAESGGMAAAVFSDLAEVGRDVLRFLSNVAQAGAPAVEIMAKLGGGAVLVGLRALADVLGPLANLLSENEVAADLLGAALAGRLAFSLVGLTSSLRVGTGLFATFGPLLATSARGAATAAGTFSRFAADVVRTAGPIGGAKIVIGGLGDALSAARGKAAGLATALKSIGPGVAITAATLGVLGVVDGLDKAEAKAKELAQRLAETGLKSNSLDEVAAAAALVGQRAQESQVRYEAAGKGWARSIKETVQLLGPWRGTISSAGEQADEYSRKVDQLNARSVHLRENIAAISKVTGLSAESISLLASHLKIDLAGGFTKTTTAVIDGARDMGRALLAAGGDAKRAVALTEAEAKAAAELADAMASAFSSASNIIGVFDANVSIGSSLTAHLREQADASRDIASRSEAQRSAQSRVAEAQRSSAEAQRQLNAALAGGDADRVAREQDQLASAQERLRDAQEGLATAQGHLADAQGRTGGGVLSFLRSQLAEATRFQTDIARLTQAGIDPTVVRELATAGPQAAASTVAGILAEVRRGNTGAVNETARSLREAQEAVRGQSLAFFQERLAESQRFAANLRELIAAGIDRDLVRELAESGPREAAGAAAALVAEVRAGNAGAINQTRSDLRTVMSQLLTDVQSYSGPLAVAMGKVGGDALSGVTAGMRSVMDRVKADTNNVLSQVLFSAVDTAALKAYASSAGKEIGSGFGTGIAAGAMERAGVGAAVTDLIDRALATGKEHAGIRSPSRLFADQIGGPLGQGIALGLREQTKAVLGEAESILAKAGGLRPVDLSPPADPRLVGVGQPSVSKSTSISQTNYITSNQDATSLAAALARQQAREAARAR
jgi:TP901 family phage tail tape measure protein